MRHIITELIESSKGYMQSHGKEGFSGFASQLLHERDLQKFCLNEALAYHSENPHVEQTYAAHPFSQRDVTLYKDRNFCLDLYFWNNGYDTSIHDHHFEGAFTTVQGESLQLEFSFSPSEELREGKQAGKLKIIDQRLVNSKSVETIRLAPQYIHQSIHLSPKVVSLCLRTSIIDHAVISSYLFDGLRIPYSPDKPIDSFLGIEEHRHSHSQYLAKLDLYRKL